MKLMRACADLGLEIPREQLDLRDDSLSFAPIVWVEAEVGEVRTSIDLSLREDLVLPPHTRTIRAALVPAFDVIHIDINEQAAEKMRCLAQRARVGDAHDVCLLWDARRDLDENAIREVVPAKLTSGRDHRAEARRGIEERAQLWEQARGRQLPHDAPTADEMVRACTAAVDRWIP